MASIVYKHDTFRRDCQKKGAEAIKLKPAFRAEGEIFSSEKGLERIGVLPSHGFGGSSLAALFSGKKMPLSS